MARKNEPAEIECKGNPWQGKKEGIGQNGIKRTKKNRLIALKAPSELHWTFQRGKESNLLKVPNQEREDDPPCSQKERPLAQIVEKGGEALTAGRVAGGKRGWKKTCAERGYGLKSLK